MARKQVVFLCLVTVGLVASLYDDCDVVAEQNIAIQTCTTANQTVSKVNGYCPMSDIVIEVPVCEDVEIKVCPQVVERDLEAHCTSFTTQHCVKSYEKHSFDGVASRRRGVEEGNTCVVERATCEDVEVEVPKEVECNHVF